MKKKFALIGAVLGLFCACFCGGCEELTDTENMDPQMYRFLYGSCAPPQKQASSAPEQYDIMYSDGVSSHTLTVTEGKLYSISQQHIPAPKDGYTFLGWFDAREYGRQYVTPDGMCVQPFLDGRDLILYPQFEANTYKIVLDYGDADVNGVTVEEVCTDENLPVLPSQLVIPTNRDMIFKGWYTEENCGGLMIADKMGISTYTCNGTFRALADENGNIRLYAGFELANYGG
ncbi:MAG: InlB B-repeat-containing protein [Clostridia bacterium]|nr:InlB B-repeat-containing protein [Clostridia bacterium]